jgi:3-hydroxyacyl-CoA dehydrogenase
MSEGRIVNLATDGEIAVISVNNPPVNTIMAMVRQELSNAIDQLGQLASVKAVVLQCEGSTFFSGADIGEFSGPPREAEYRSLFARFEALPVPMIAAKHGTVLGGGLEIALACHYRIADPRTRFGLPEVTLGIIPGAGGTQRLPRLIGAERALELILGRDRWIRRSRWSTDLWTPSLRATCGRAQRTMHGDCWPEAKARAARASATSIC